MKKLALLIIYLITLNYSSTYSQVKVCESTKENNFDINTIDINKCEITKKEDSAREISIIKTIVRKRIKNRFSKVKNERKLANNLSSNNNLSLLIEDEKPKINLPTQSKVILFNLVEEVPLFEGCKKSTKEENNKCFKEQLNSYISKHFIPEEITDETIRERFLIQFTITLYGKIENIEIKSKSNNTLIIKELQNTLSSLTNLTPGKEKGLPVNVTYSFPLNLTLN